MSIFKRVKKFFQIKIIKTLGVVILIFLGVLIISITIFNFKCSSAQPNFKTIEDEIPSKFKTARNDIKDYNRTEESTYLTFPEWYLVFNPQEYGQFIGEEKPSHFPYFASIGQFWGGYCQVYGITKRNYPFNSGNHLMGVVIGTSFTAEYTMKGVWENTIGRITEWLSFGEQTQEDLYAAKVAQEYGDFIPTVPWYEFPYAKKLVGLWSETNFFGKHFIRKMERKVFLSLEYGVKTVYATLIKTATRAVYGVADTEIYVSVKNTPNTIFQDTRFRKIKDLGDDSYIITVPHYQGFTDTIPLLVLEGVDFVDFAGNDEILLTAVAPRDWSYDLQNGTLLFTMGMMNNSNKRIVVQAPVRSLSEILKTLEARGVKMEHLYDY